MTGILNEGSEINNASGTFTMRDDTGKEKLFIWKSKDYSKETISFSLSSQDGVEICSLSSGNYDPAVNFSGRQQALSLLTLHIIPHILAVMAQHVVLMEIIKPKFTTLKGSSIVMLIRKEINVDDQTYLYIFE